VVLFYRNDERLGRAAMLSRTLGLMKITAVIVKGETDAEFEVKRL